MGMENQEQANPKYKYLFWIFVAVGVGEVSIVFHLYFVDQVFFVFGIFLLSILVGLHTKNSLFPFVFSFVSMLTSTILIQTFIGPSSLVAVLVFVSETSLMCGILGFLSAQTIKKKNMMEQKNLIIVGFVFGILLIVWENYFGDAFYLLLAGNFSMSILTGLLTERKSSPFSFVFPCVIIYEIYWALDLGIPQTFYEELVVFGFWSSICIPGVVLAWYKQRKSNSARKREFASRSAIFSAHSHSMDSSQHGTAFYKVKSVFLSKGSYIDGEGVHIPRRVLSDIHIPYSSIIKCSYSQESEEDACTIEYYNQKGDYKTVELHSTFDDLIGALKAYSDILRVSKTEEYKIRRGKNVELAKFVDMLNDANIDFELIEPEDQYIRTSSQGKDQQCWERKLGTLTFAHGPINLMEINERGRAAIVEETHYSSSNNTSYTTRKIKYYPTYLVDAILGSKSIPQVETYGQPVEEKGGTKSIWFWVGIVMIFFGLVVLFFDLFFLFGFGLPSLVLGLVIAVAGFASKRISDYKWKGDECAERLNNDIELREILTRSEAPPIEICGNRIRVKGSQLPEKEIFCCVSRIAEHMSSLSISSS